MHTFRLAAAAYGAIASEVIVVVDGSEVSPVVLGVEAGVVTPVAGVVVGRRLTPGAALVVTFEPPDPHPASSRQVKRRKFIAPQYLVSEVVGRSEFGW
jgi:hypothetical protein